MEKKRTSRKSTSDAAAPISVLPRPDVSDAELVAAISEGAGLPTKVMDKLGMSLDDLMARAKASRKVAGAFAEARQRQVDVARAYAFKIAVGDSKTPPDPAMLRWLIKRYE